MWSNSECEWIYINSAERVGGGTSTNFNIPVIYRRDREYDSVVVTQVSIPISYSLIPAGYDTFTLREDATSVLITIPDGNYNINSFCTTVSNLLNVNSPNHLTYTMTYNQGYTNNLDGKIYYTVTGAHTCSLIMGPNYLYYQFGFNNNTTNTFAGGALKSVNVCSFVNETTIFIHSDLYTNGQDDVLQEIYQQNASPMSYVTYLCQDVMAYAKKIRPTFSVVHFTITDEFEVPLNLNGLEVEITLMLFNSQHYWSEQMAIMKKEFGLMQDTFHLLLQNLAEINASIKHLVSVQEAVRDRGIMVDEPPEEKEDWEVPQVTGADVASSF